MSTLLELPMALVTVSVYAVGLYALISQRSRQNARVDAARVQTARVDTAEMR